MHAAQAPLLLRLRRTNLNKKITPTPTPVQTLFYNNTLAIRFLLAVSKQPQDEQKHIDKIKVQGEGPED